MNKLKHFFILILCIYSTDIFATEAVCYLKNLDKEESYTCKKYAYWAYWVSSRQVLDDRWSDTTGCDFTSKVADGIKNITIADNLATVCSGRGVVQDNKLIRVCFFYNDKEEGPHPYTFLSWSYTKDSDRVYTSYPTSFTDNMQPPERDLGTPIDMSIANTRSKYVWLDEKGNNYEVSKNSNSEGNIIWTIMKNGTNLSPNGAKCGILSDVFLAGFNNPNYKWYSKEAYDNFKSY
ncbi:MAG: hypothetical protein K0R14_1887 [Burkholderiales bacterium]|jgi:hypothetical protein|nr:hypothetical protein [Burkholderiales bacterium]